MGLRILLLTTDAWGGHGGIALYNRDLAAALALLPEVEEVVVIVRNMPLQPEPTPAKVRFIADAVGGKLRFVGAACKQLPTKVDLLVCGHINLLSLAVLCNLKWRAPLALLVYGIDAWQQPARFTCKWLKHVTVVWSISAITRDKMSAWSGIPIEKFVLLPNCIHLDRYALAPKPADLLERYNLQGSKVIMTLARLVGIERYKGVDEIMEALPAILDVEPQVKYLVAGDGSDRPRLEHKARQLGLQETIIFAGMVDEARKADHYRLADVFAMPGRGEGFGFVFLEALACGIPVVASTLDGSREAVREGMLGELVNPDDSADLVRGILAALAKPKAIPAGLDWFAWPNFVQRTTDAVHKLLA